MGLFRTRARRRVGVISAGGAVTVLAIALVAVVATGFTPSRSRLLDGGAWLADDTNMPHASGPNAAVDAAVQACPDPDDCRWVQRDGLAYLLRPGIGQAYRLDTATRRFDQQAVAIGAGNSRLLVGTGRVYSIDSAQQAIVSRDPLTLAPRGEPITPAGGAGDALVDRGGVLWVVEPATGTLLGIDDTSVRFRVNIAPSGQGLTVGSIDDTPVVLDPAGRTIVALDDRGKEARRIELGTFAADRVVLGRDLPAGPLYLIERGSGRIGRISLDAAAADVVGQLDVGDDVNAVYVVGAKVFAVQPGARTVRWLSLDDRTEQPPIGDATEVFVKDSYLFVNDVRAREAVVAGPDTDPQRVLKRRDDIPKGEVPVEVNNYNPIPPSVTTTTTNEQANAENRASTTTSSAQAPSSTTSSTAPISSTTLPATDVPPAAPTNVTADPGDSQATVRWNAPLTNVDRFEIEAAGGSAPFNPAALPASACAGGDCSVLIRSLANGSTYRFVVYAVSTTNTRSAPSAPSNAVTVDADLPGDPGNVVAVGKAKTRVRVSWSAAPAGTGGRTITEYIVQPLDLNKQDTGSAVRTAALETDVDVPGAAPATYYFRVQAQNNAGKVSGGAVSGQAVGPYGAPAAVAMSALSAAGCGQQPDTLVNIPVSWSAIPPPPGDASNGYRVTVNGVPVASVPDPSYTMAVAAGRDSTVSVLAYNESGDGPSSSQSIRCPAQDPVQSTSPPVLQLNTTSVTATEAVITLTQMARSQEADAAKGGSQCCYIDLTNPTIYVTGATGPTLSAPLNPSGQLSPGSSAVATVDVSSLPPGSYTAELRDSLGNVLVSSSPFGTAAARAIARPNASPLPLTVDSALLAIRRNDP